PDYTRPSVPAAEQGGPDGRYARWHRHAHAAQDLWLLALQAVPGHCRAAEHPQPCPSADHLALHRHHRRANRKQSQDISPVKLPKFFCGVFVLPKKGAQGGSKPSEMDLFGYIRFQASRIFWGGFWAFKKDCRQRVALSFSSNGFS